MPYRKRAVPGLRPDASALQTPVAVIPDDEVDRRLERRHEIKAAFGVANEGVEPVQNSFPHGDDHRFKRRASPRIENPVRNEAAVGEGPEQLVDVLCAERGVGDHLHFPPGLVEVLDDVAQELSLLRGNGFHE